VVSDAPYKNLDVKSGGVISFAVFVSTPMIAFNDAYIFVNLESVTVRLTPSHTTQPDGSFEQFGVEVYVLKYGNIESAGGEVE
jgi:hypothetical protein